MPPGEWEFGRWLHEVYTNTPDPERPGRTLSRRRLGTLANVSDTTLQLYEHGERRAGGIVHKPNPSEPVLHRIADVLDVPYEEICKRAGMERCTGGARRAVERGDGTPLTPDQRARLTLALRELREVAAELLGSDPR